MPNERNLIPYRFTSDQSREEAAKNGAAGGRASGESKRRRKRLKEAVDIFFSLPVVDEKLHAAMENAGVDEEDCNYQTMVIMGLVKAAAQGDSRAARVLFEALDDQKEAQQEHGAESMQALADILGHPVPNRNIKDFEE